MSGSESQDPTALDARMTAQVVKLQDLGFDADIGRVRVGLLTGSQRSLLDLQKFSFSFGFPPTTSDTHCKWFDTSDGLLISKQVIRDIAAHSMMRHELHVVKHALLSASAPLFGSTCKDP